MTRYKLDNQYVNCENAVTPDGMKIIKIKIKMKIIKIKTNIYAPMTQI